MKQSTDQVKWDFSYWMELAMNHPDEFESRRAETIKRAIEKAPEDSRLRLERLQWRIDRVRERSSSPMAATLEISRMMWDSFYTLRDRYHDVFNTGTPVARRLNPPQTAEVIEFPQLTDAQS